MGCIPDIHGNSESLKACYPCTAAGSCDVLSDPENGEVTFSSTVYLSRAVYSCNDGYELSQTGSVVRICRTNGQWSSFAPQCNRKLKYSINAS